MVVTVVFAKRKHTAADGRLAKIRKGSRKQIAGRSPQISATFRFLFPTITSPSCLLAICSLDLVRSFRRHLPG